ncbi:MAG: ice-binding family protein [Candidatus Paceibacterota bacterium]|jgi:hypothetical protein
MNKIIKKMNKFNKKLILATIAISSVFGLVGPITTLALGPSSVDLGLAGGFSILAKTAITNTGSATVVGNIGISPAAASYMTGFGPVMDVSNTFSTSALVTGRIYAANYTAPTPSYMTTSISNMETAYTDAAGRALPDGTNLYSGLIGGQTFAPGLYKWTTNVSLIDGTATLNEVTLNGGASDVWIFQIAGNLIVPSYGSIPLGAKVILTGGALASNVFWQVGGGAGATLGTYSTFNGNILSATDIVMQTGAVLNGRALSQTQVTMDANSVSGISGSGPATLNVIKVVSGGVAAPSDFMLHVKNSLNADVSGSPLVGAGSPGTPYTLSAGTYTVSEDANTNYNESFSGDCNANGSVTLSSGDNKTCTITNTAIPHRIVRYGTITVNKVVINDDGGTKIVADFPLFVNDAQVASGATTTFRTSSYTIREISNSNYTQSFSGDCDVNGVLVLDTNQNKVCTIINNDIAQPWQIVIATTSTPVVSTTGSVSLPIGNVSISSSTAIISPILAVTPRFPNTGIFPETGNMALNIIIAVIIVSLISTTLVWILKRVRIAAGISRAHLE